MNFKVISLERFQMKQISTGTGLVVLSGTVLASVFLSSPRTATTAFASAQNTQPVERSVDGIRGSKASLVADCQATESLQWFSATPKVIQGCTLSTSMGDSQNGYIKYFNADINNDGNNEYFVSDNSSDSSQFFLNTIEPVIGVATSKLILLCSFDSQSINNYRSSVGLSSDDYWYIWGLRDCDNDGDFDLVIGSGVEGFMYFENTGFQHTAALEGDLNGDGHVDSEDLGRLLGGYTG
jgi:hypothetical protein